MKKEYYEAHKEEIKRKARERYKKNRARILNQKNERYTRERDNILTRRRKAWKENSEIKKNHDKYHRQLKNKCYEILGGKCVRCGEANHDLLSIDHINEDGAQERKSLTLVKLRSNIVNGVNRENYQLLCFNCNLKKHLNYEERFLLIGRDKYCPTCRLSKDESQFKKDKLYEDGYYYECRFCVQSRELEVKIKVFNLLGKSQCNCGISDVDVLTVDIEEIGKKRKWLGSSLYRKILQGALNAQNYQVLCLNCNILKSLQNGDKQHATNLKIGSYITEVDFEEPVTKTTLEYDLVNFDFEDIIIQNIDREKSVVFLENYHYIGFGRSGFGAYGVFLGDKLIAVVKFAPPVRQKVASSIGYESNKIFELDRFCIHPAYQKKNFASFLLSRVVKLVKRDYSDIKCLVSFADPRYGHDGTIYKAANWKFVRKTAYSYAYENGKGEEINKKTLYNWSKVRGMTEKEGVEQLCLKKIKLPRKLKFVYEL